MLQNSFQHIPGIGEKTELDLWNAGLTHWQQVAGFLSLPPRKLETIARHIRESQRQLEAGNPGYFSDLLPPNSHWRLFPEFRNATAYLDIETTGLEMDNAEITTIALYDGKEIRHYVQGRNLDAFTRDIKAYSQVITYNGKTFDVPFIEGYFNIKMNHAHIDLRYVLKSLGYGGGLKRCEKALGIQRGDLDGVDGFFAVLLWQDYQRNGNEKALETLLAYNIEDVVNLETLMIMAYNMKIQQTPFAESHQLPLPRMPEIPFTPDFPTISRIKREIYF